MLLSGNLASTRGLLPKRDRREFAKVRNGNCGMKKLRLTTELWRIRLAIRVSLTSVETAGWGRRVSPV